MKKVLLLTYYYAPCNYVAANRPSSFAQLLSEAGFEVTVVTRHWTGKEAKWKDYIASNICPIAIESKSSTLNVHYLPYVEIKPLQQGIRSKIYTLRQYIKGNFNYELDYLQFENYIDSLACREKYDYLLVSTPPLTALKVAANISQKHRIKLLVDIRDFENDILLAKSPNATILRRLQHRLVMQYFKQWAREAMEIFTITPPITAYLAEHTGKEVFTLTNGFDKALIHYNEPLAEDAFTLSVIGTLYPEANISVFCEGLKLLFERHKNLRIRFNMIGVTIVESVAARFRAVIPALHLHMTDRLPRADALKIAASSHVLFQSGFDNMKGTLTTKVFEYFGLRKNILQAPGDRDMVEAMINKIGAGKTPHGAEEVYEAIISWYREWEETGVLSYKGDIDEIKRYTREAQFQLLLERLID